MGFYRGGTIDVTQGSINVVGTGTVFAAQVKPGDLLMTAGTVGMVASVESNSAMTLVLPWTGATAEDVAAYAVNHTGEGWASAKTASEAILTLTQLYEGASPYMRTVLDDIDAATARATLGAYASAGGQVSGPIDHTMSYTTAWHHTYTATPGLAPTEFHLFQPGSGMILITSYDLAQTALYICGGGAVMLVSQTGDQYRAGEAGNFVFINYAPERGVYYLQNATTATQTFGIAMFRTRPNA